MELTACGVRGIGSIRGNSSNRGSSGNRSSSNRGGSIPVSSIGISSIAISSSRISSIGISSIGKRCCDNLCLLSSLTLHFDSRGSLNSGKVFSLGSSYLRGVFWGNKGLRVEGGSNTIINWSNGETRVFGSEAKGISSIGNLLELACSINIGVATRDSTKGVAHLLLDRVQVGISVVQVAKLILSMELTACGVRGIGSIRGNSSNRG